MGKPAVSILKSALQVSLDESMLDLECGFHFSVLSRQLGFYNIKGVVILFVVFYVNSV